MTEQHPWETETKRLILDAEVRLHNAQARLDGARRGLEQADHRLAVLHEARAISRDLAATPQADA